MSIAVSVPIVPSRLLRRLTLAYAAACIVMGAAGAAGLPGPLRWPAPAGGVCILAGLGVIWRGGKHAGGRVTARRIDVLGPGRLVLTVQLAGGPEQRLVLRLLPDSTLWPGLLVLRLSALPTLVLLPDSLPPGSFRQLLVALRSASGRAGEVIEEIPKKRLNLLQRGNSYT